MFNKNLHLLLALITILFIAYNGMTKNCISAYNNIHTNTKENFINNDIINCSLKNSDSYEQNRGSIGNSPAYINNNDETITDITTGLMWYRIKDKKLTYSEAIQKVKEFRSRKYSDWRLPNIEELYSLINFSKTDINLKSNDIIVKPSPFTNRQRFTFQYGDLSRGEFSINSQFLSSTKYKVDPKNNIETVFGVNFANGRIKGYGLGNSKTGYEKKFYVLFVRGNRKKGTNSLKIKTDKKNHHKKTGLMWITFNSEYFKSHKNNYAATI